MPAYKLIHDLFSRIDFPLAQSSANISNAPTKARIQEIIDEFEDESQKPDLIINAGDLRSASPSTVMDLTKEKPEILRQGEIEINL
jgi:L-threonylcarbamoyladenylate synthase